MSRDSDKQLRVLPGGSSSSRRGRAPLVAVGEKPGPSVLQQLSLPGVYRGCKRLVSVGFECVTFDDFEKNHCRMERDMRSRHTHAYRISQSRLSAVAGESII